MKLQWRSVTSLKASVLVTFVLLWNAGFLISIYIGGGSWSGGQTSLGMKISGLVCLAACLFTFAVARSKSVQEKLIAPSRSEYFNTREFYFLAVVSGVLAISRFILPAGQ